MEKTEMMKEHEARTGLRSTRVLGDHWCNEEVHTENYVDDLEERLTELQAKAEAYDRLMSGGKKSLKEWANIFGMNVVVEPDYWTEDKLRCVASDRKLYLKESETIYGKVFLWANEVRGHQYEIPFHLVDYSGDWKNSLTLPDGWEESK